MASDASTGAGGPRRRRATISCFRSARCVRRHRPRRAARARRSTPSCRITTYPEPVAQALGEAVALTAMLGTALKFDGKLIVQTKTDGILDFLVVNFEAPGTRARLRALRQDALRARPQSTARIDEGALLGSGHLAITIDPGEDMERYQGIVALEGGTLVDAAHTYFRQSEQLPTFMRLAVARHYRAGDGRGARRWHWRAGGLMIQKLAAPAASRMCSRRTTRSALDRRRRGRLGARAHSRGDRGGSRAARSDAFARAPALSAVPRGRRARDAGQRRSKPTAAARASASKPS